MIRKIRISCYLSFFILGVSTTITKCPDKILWRARATEKCSLWTEYHCLLDGSTKQYIEKCLVPKAFRPGLKVVYNIQLHAVNCTNETFSPYSVLSNDLFECFYIKSYCNEEGQVIVSNGTGYSDRSCRCDYTRGYDYINKPNNPCGCKPLMEDCSCYKNSCKQNNISIEGYKCINTYVGDTFSCGNIQNVWSQEKSNKTMPYVDRRPEPNVLSPRRDPIIWISIIPTIICSIIFASILSFYVWSRRITGFDVCSRRKTTTKSSENTTESACNVIFHQVKDMTVVPYYQRTRHVDKIKENIQKGIRMVILKGMYGAGKTQTAHQFCKEMKSKYSIIAKLVASNKESLIDSLIMLSKNISLNLDMDKEENEIVLSLATSITNYLSHEARKQCSYLILIDDVPDLTDYIKDLEDPFRSVENLTLLLTTRNSNLTISYVKAKVVNHYGMSKKEYIEFFRNTEYFSDIPENDIKAIVIKLGTLPIALNSAREYIAKTHSSIQSYLMQFNERGDTDTNKNPFYKYGLLQSQIIPLKYIRDHLEGKLWDVLMYLPLLEYTSISLEVLKACYIHMQEEKTSVSDIGNIVDLCSQFSIFVSHKECRHRLLPRTNEAHNFTTYSFHAVTKRALKKLGEISHDPKKKLEQLCFLMKVFCFEIDVFARDDITLERNLLFLPHAKKVLEKILRNEKELDDRHKVYLVYLYCVVGKTLLFEGSERNIISAHKYLMKSRTLWFHIMEDQSSLTIKHCVGKQKATILKEQNDDLTQDLVPNKDDIRKWFKNVFEITIDKELAEQFIMSKRRSVEDVNILQTESGIEKMCKHHYLRKREYEQLVQKKLAIPLHLFQRTFFSELTLHILYENGRALNELKYIKRNNIRVQQACYFEYFTCNTISELMKSSAEFEGYELVLYLDTERSGQFCLRSSHESNITIEQINSELQDIKRILNSKVKKFYFNFGVVKTTSDSYQHHTCMCYRYILKDLERIYKMSSDIGIKDKIFDEGKVTVNDLQLILMEQEGASTQMVALPKFHVQCATFLQISSEKQNLEHALELYEKTIEIEKNGHFTSNRFLCEAYKGKIECLCKLQQSETARTTLEDLTKTLQGANENLLTDLNAIINNSVNQKVFPV